MNVVPAIFPNSFDDIVTKLNAFSYEASRVQIDLCDGESGLTETWLPEGGESLPDDYEYEFDIMTTDWKNYVKSAIDMGAGRVVVHVDQFSEGDANELIAILEHTGIALGVCVANTSPLEDHDMFIKFFEESYGNVFIQVMGIRAIGAQGQPFDETVLARIQTLKEDFPHLYLQVDGSMNNETVQKVKDAGADSVIVGSYLFSGDSVIAKIQELEEI